MILNNVIKVPMIVLRKTNVLGVVCEINDMSNNA